MEEKEKIAATVTFRKEEAARTYQIPFPKRTEVSQPCLNLSADRFLSAIVSRVFTQDTALQGSFRKLDPMIKLAATEIKRENPRLTIPPIIEIPNHMKLRGQMRRPTDRAISISSKTAVFRDQ